MVDVETYASVPLTQRAASEGCLLSLGWFLLEHFVTEVLACQNPSYSDRQVIMRDLGAGRYERVLVGRRIFDEGVEEPELANLDRSGDQQRGQERLLPQRLGLSPESSHRARRGRWRSLHQPQSSREGFELREAELIVEVGCLPSKTVRVVDAKVRRRELGRGFEDPERLLIRGEQGSGLCDPLPEPNGGEELVDGEPARLAWALGPGDLEHRRRAQVERPAVVGARGVRRRTGLDALDP
ncbi:MAG TPA: hypothetical protein VKY89_10245 [Thermoanaerobaculia bacterium]|nr:hypothetical protein [Thermoanaerobaculia bacterium]